MDVVRASHVELASNLLHFRDKPLIDFRFSLLALAIECRAIDGNNVTGVELTR